MSQEKLAMVMKVFDSETQLIERADRKAIALLSVLGVFMVFFIVYYRLIPVNPITVALSASYFVCAIFSIANLVITVRPRIYREGQGEKVKTDEMPSYDPTFFRGICRFKSLSAYRQALEAMVSDDSATFNIYTQQVFNLARLNDVKYKYLRRATYITIAALAIELSIIIYLFSNYMGSGVMPPII